MTTTVKMPEPAQAMDQTADALEWALSVCNSVNMEHDRKFRRDGCTMYLQTEEWCKWVADEVGPMLHAALDAHRAEVMRKDFP